MKIGVVGLGKLGLPMAALYAGAGHKVVGLDLNEIHIQTLKDKKFTSPEPILHELLEVAQPNIRYTTEWKRLRSCNVIFIVAPTPSLSSGGFDDARVIQALQYMHSYYRNQIVVVVSTLMPGQMDNMHRDFPKMRFVYSPEFIALGSVVEDMRNPDMVLIGGYDESDMNSAIDLFFDIIQQSVPVAKMTPVEAELSKLSLNAYLGIKIGYANFIGELAARVGADPAAVLRGVGLDSRVGTKYLKAGMPVMGPCLPRDQVALKALAQTKRVPSYLTTAAMQTDVRRRVNIAQEALQHRAPFAVIGLPYKPGSNVTDASIGQYVVNAIHGMGEPVHIWDPQFEVEFTLREANTIVLCDVAPEIRRRVLSWCEKRPEVFLLDCWSWQ